MTAQITRKKICTVRCSFANAAQLDLTSKVFLRLFAARPLAHWHDSIFSSLSFVVFRRIIVSSVCCCPPCFSLVSPSHPNFFVAVEATLYR